MQTIQFHRAGVDLTSFAYVVMRGRTRPRILDWNRDGKDDLVVGTREIRVDRNLRKFDLDAWLRVVEREQQAQVPHDYKAENHLRTSDVVIPEFARLQPKQNGSNKPVPVGKKDGFNVVRRTNPTFVQFADFNGDGDFDLLAIVESYFWFRDAKFSTLDEEQLRRAEATLRPPPPRHTLVWLRNTTSGGEPAFAAAQPLYQVHGNLVLQSFAVTDFDDDGAQEIVAALTERDPHNTRRVTSKQLVLLDRR